MTVRLAGAGIRYATGGVGRTLRAGMANTKRGDVKAAALSAARKTAGRLADKNATEKSYGIWRAALDAAAEASHAAGDAFDDDIRQIADEVEAIPELSKTEPDPTVTPELVDIASSRKVRRLFKRWGIAVQAIAAVIQTVLLGFTLTVYRRQADISDAQTRILKQQLSAQNVADDVAYHVDLSRLRKATKAILELCYVTKMHPLPAAYLGRTDWLKSVSELMENELTNPALIRNDKYFETWKDGCDYVDLIKGIFTNTGDVPLDSPLAQDQARLFAATHEDTLKRMTAFGVAFGFFRESHSAPSVGTLPKPLKW